MSDRSWEPRIVSDVTMRNSFEPEGRYRDRIAGERPTGKVRTSMRPRGKKRILEATVRVGGAGKYGGKYGVESTDSSRIARGPD